MWCYSTEPAPSNEYRGNWAKNRGVLYTLLGKGTYQCISSLVSFALKEYFLEWGKHKCSGSILRGYLVDCPVDCCVCVWQSLSSRSHVAYLRAQRAEFRPCLSPCAEAHNLNSKGTGIGKASA